MKKYFVVFVKTIFVEIAVKSSLILLQILNGATFEGFYILLV